MVEIKRESLAGKQVNGDGIAREGVHGEQVEVLGGLPFEREPRVAEGNFHARLTVAEKRELAAGDLQHQRIDLVKPKIVSRAPVRREGAGAEADDSGADGPVRLGFSDSRADARFRAVVSGGQVA